jgi:hypothetical protein
MVMDWRVGGSKDAIITILLLAALPGILPARKKIHLRKHHVCRTRQISSPKND